MRRFVSFLLLFSLSLVLPACRSRRTPPPAPAPPVVTESQPQEPPPTTTVETPQREFPPEPEPEVLSEDIVEANRQARARGWIQDAFFAFDASTLDDDAQDALRATAKWLRDHPEWKIRIEGHCDERGTEQYNLALGDRRAETAAAFLATLGVGRERIQTVSYGEQRPFEPGSDEASWAQNRRAHVVLASRR